MTAHDKWIAQIEKSKKARHGYKEGHAAETKAKCLDALKEGIRNG